MISGALFAFITSFDEVVVVLFVGSAQQKTLPWQMFIGLREQISPTILAVATMLVAISVALLTTLELLRRRSERLRGLSPGEAHETTVNMIYGCAGTDKANHRAGALTKIT